jgi:hypothetical protein
MRRLAEVMREIGGEFVNAEATDDRELPTASDIRA